jgi:hypothetical protein
MEIPSSSQLIDEKLSRLLEKLSSEEILEFAELLIKFASLIKSKPQSDFDEVLSFLELAQSKNSSEVFTIFLSIAFFARRKRREAAKVLLEEEYLKQ